MAVKIRFARGGAKNRAFFRMVVSDSRSPRDGKFIEKLGTFNPHIAKGNEKRFVFDADRVKYWLSVGAETSEIITKLLTQAGLKDKMLDKQLARIKISSEALKSSPYFGKSRKEKKAMIAAAAEAAKAAAEAAKNAPAAAPAEAAPAAEAAPTA